MSDDLNIVCELCKSSNFLIKGKVESEVEAWELVCLTCANAEIPMRYEITVVKMDKRLESKEDATTWFNRELKDQLRT